MGLESYALESRRRGVIDRTQSEDIGHEEVEEVLNVANTLHDMGRGRHVRNSSGAGSADGSAHPRAVLLATDIDKRARRPRGSWRLHVHSESAAKGGDGRGCKTGGG